TELCPYLSRLDRTASTSCGFARRGAAATNAGGTLASPHGQHPGSAGNAQRPKSHTGTLSLKIKIAADPQPQSAGIGMVKIVKTLYQVDPEDREDIIDPDATLDIGLC